MKISLDDVIRNYISLARNITNETGETVEVFIKDIKIVETYVDYGEDKAEVFTCYNSKMNFNPILKDFDVFCNKDFEK